VNHPAREARSEATTLQVWAESLLLWCFVTFIFAAVTVGACVSFVVWFFTSPVLWVLMVMKEYQLKRRARLLRRLQRRIEETRP
jgi:hypothetical protein